jgi:6-phosphogluconolactonase
MVSKNPKIQIVADIDAMIRASAETIVAHVVESLKTCEVYSIALSGGATPRPLYELLANDAKMQEQIPWDRVHFFWGDERHVTPSHPDSNYRMADTALLSKVPIPSTNIHRIRAEDPDADKAAADYEREIRRFFKIDAGQLPRFNCMLQGMGPDGHTASLFPGTSALEETRRLAVANWVEKFQSYRITMTVAVINNADRIIFIVSGEEKADTLKAVLQDDPKSNRYPVQRIQPSDGKLIWFLDQAAAGRLVHDRYPG